MELNDGFDACLDGILMTCPVLMGHGWIHELEELGTSGWSANVFDLRYQLLTLFRVYVPYKL